MYRRLLPILAVTALAATGCVRTTAGAAGWDAANATKPLDADITNQVLLRSSQLRDIMGERLELFLDDKDAPDTRTASLPECSALQSIGRQAFVGDDWTGLREMMFVIGRPSSGIIEQAAAVYPDAPSAAAAFVAATKDVAACDGKEVMGPVGGASMKYAVTEVTADTVRWSRDLVGPSAPCYYQARVRNNAIVQAMSCQEGSRGERTAQTIADNLSAKVWDLSAR